MAERKSVNKYYPPDWDPSKGSVNKYVGQHPLRDRARKLSQGILVIRFEMPYNIWCGGCNNHIGMGVRYNAEKTKTGMYYSTPIYKFRMKCHLCPNHFEIQTDPKNHDYVILEGARRKEQRWDPKENEQIVPEDRATHKKMATDAMFKLEHGSDDQKRGKAVVMTLSNLEGRRDEWKDDYVLNKIARQKFREEKVSIKSVQESDAALLSKSSLEIPLVQEKEEDKKLAQLMKYRTVESYDEKQAQKRKDITNRPIFQSNKVPKLDISPTNNKKLDIIQKHLRTAGNKSSPFDSGRSKFVSKSGVHQSSLGIRRKPVKSVVHTEKEMSMDSTHSGVHTVDLTETATDSVSDPVLHKGSPENDIRKDLDPKIRNPVESVQEEKEQISLYENSIIANQIIVNSPKAEQIDARSIKNEKTKSHNYGENISRPDRCLNCAELVTEADKNDLKLVSCKSNPSCLKESPCSGKSLKTDKNDSEEDKKISVNEPKRSCDNMHVKETKIESCSTVCDRNTKTEDKTELETTAKEELVNKNYPEIKVDRKKLSLVAPYSDSESDSSS